MNDYHKFRQSGNYKFVTMAKDPGTVVISELVVAYFKIP